MEKTGSRWSSPVQGLSLRGGGFQGVFPEDRARVMANPLGATSRALLHCGVSLGPSLSQHRAHHLLFHHHFTPRSTQPDPVCLQDQQHVRNGSRGVSTQHRRGPGCTSQGSTPRVSKAVQDGEGHGQE